MCVYVSIYSLVDVVMSIYCRLRVCVSIPNLSKWHLVAASSRCKWNLVIELAAVRAHHVGVGDLLQPGSVDSEWGRVCILLCQRVPRGSFQCFYLQENNQEFQDFMTLPRIPHLLSSIILLATSNVSCFHQPLSQSLWSLSIMKIFFCRIWPKRT